MTPITFLSSFIIIVASCIVVFFYFSMKSLKSREFKKLSRISEKILFEKKLTKDIQVHLQKMNLQNKSIDHQLLSIHLDIRDIDFSIKEICNFIGV